MNKNVHSETTFMKNFTMNSEMKILSLTSTHSLSPLLLWYGSESACCLAKFPNLLELTFGNLSSKL